MLPAAEVILEAARCCDWCAVLGLAPGARLTPKQERAYRVEVHPDRGRRHDVAAAVAQALDALRIRAAPPPGNEVDRLIEECSRAVQREPLNGAGGAALRRLLDALVLARTAASLPRLRYYYKGWGEQARRRCYGEVLRIWPPHRERMRSEPLRAADIGREFLAEAAEIDSFRDSLTEAPRRIWYADCWVHSAVQEACRTPVAIRHRKTKAQKIRRAERRANSATLSEAEALASVLEHCEIVEARLATPLGKLRADLQSRGVNRNVLLAAGISSQTRRQHRPLQGESFYYATVASGGKRRPLRLRD